MDNARRTRAVMEAQMRRLVADLHQRQGELGPPYFTFATSVEEYLPQVDQLKEQYQVWSGGRHTP